MTDETTQADANEATTGAEATETTGATETAETTEAGGAAEAGGAEAAAAGAEGAAGTEPGADIEPVTEPQIIETMDAAIALAASLVQVKRPPLPALAWHTAELPETQVLPDGSQRVLLVRDTDMQQVVRHGGHEAIHVVCGVESRHWGHEMIAEVFSLELVRRQHDPYYYGRARADAGRDDGIAPGTEPPVSFGAAYNTGEALLRVMKPAQLYSVGRFPATDEGVRAWLASLPRKTADKARAVIRTTIGEAAAASLETGD